MKYKMMFRASKEGKGLSKLTFLHIETCIWHMTFKACFHVPISIGVHFFPCSFIYNTLWLLTIYGCTRQDINHGFGHWGSGAHSSQLKRSCNHLSLITLTPSAHTHVGVFYDRSTLPHMKTSFLHSPEQVQPVQSSVCAMERSWMRCLWLSGQQFPNINPWKSYRLWSVLCSSKQEPTLTFLSQNTFLHLVDVFIQSDLQCILGIQFLWVHAFPGIQTYDLGIASAVFYYLS